MLQGSIWGLLKLNTLSTFRPLVITPHYCTHRQHIWIVSLLKSFSRFIVLDLAHCFTSNLITCLDCFCHNGNECCRYRSGCAEHQDRRCTEQGHRYRKLITEENPKALHLTGTNLLYRSQMKSPTAKHRKFGPLILIIAHS
jgi:hypothetical protein